MIEELEKLLEDWKDDQHSEDSYLMYKEDEKTGEEYSLDETLSDFFNQYENVQWTLDYVGRFDSPGYDLWCYCLAVVYEGKLFTYPLKEENY